MMRHKPIRDIVVKLSLRFELSIVVRNGFAAAVEWCRILEANGYARLEAGLRRTPNKQKQYADDAENETDCV